MREALWTIRGKKLAVLGLAFKGGTDDVRDSPALELVRRFVEEGAQITAYDPAAMPRAQAMLPEGAITYATDAYAACLNADAVLVLTEWPEFADLDLARVRTLLKLPIVLDGKNLLDPNKVQAAGLHYFGVGCGASPAPLPVTSAQRTAAPSAALQTSAA